MSERIGNCALIYAEEPQQCDFCGKIAELRPYGPNGECICFACSEKDPEARDRMADKFLFGSEETTP